MIDALVGIPVLDDTWRIYDGYPVDDDDRDMYAVGVEDPFDPGRTDSADSSRVYPLAAGRAMDETGTIRCCLEVAVGEAGDAGMRAARERAFSALDAIEGYVRNTLGALPAYQRTSVSDVRLYQDQRADRGSWVLVAFSVAYLARI